MPFTDQCDGGAEVRHHLEPSLIGNAGRHCNGHELAPRSGQRLRGEEPRDPGVAHAAKVHLDRLLELGEGQSSQGIERADIGWEGRRSSPQHRSMPANGLKARHCRTREPRFGGEYGPRFRSMGLEVLARGEESLSGCKNGLDVQPEVARICRAQR